MSKRKATSSDVAKKAGVSQATVSMVLNRKYNVSFSRETIERVEQAARELGYELPNRRNKKENKKEKLIVVFCPTLTSPYYVLLLQGIESVANQQGYGVFICNTQRDARVEEKYLHMMQTVRPQGIIYTCNPNPDFQKRVEELAMEIPLVIISNKEKTTTVDAINQDNTVVGRLMARHLLDLGHRDVAFITPPLTKRQWQRSKRIDGFVKEFEREGLKGHVIIKAADESMDRQLPRMDSEYSMGYQLTMELLDENRNFTAIAGQNDMMAFGAVDALQERRLHVPKDVSVIGCDNIFYSGIRRMSLTTIEHFVALKGRDACDIVIRKIDMNDQFYTGIHPTSLYNIEYTPKVIARKTTSYARTRKNADKENNTSGKKHTSSEERKK
ncbi:MAG: LacI family DNA-binding transcriptional regulator [Eubacteriales bacterium]|nr:LacI family DNA-binding transcriptional regulator [Eubacteriales bacterium]